MAEKEEESSGDSTDVFSSKFDPLKALCSDAVKAPDENAPVFDNISKFESFCFHQKTITTRTTASASDTKKDGVDRLTSTRESTIVRRKNHLSGKNVINRMEKHLGPLSALYKYMENRVKVKVLTRSVDGVRGYIEAYVAAFDTHWNLALEDCYEVWTRKIARKAPALGVDSERRIKTETNTNLQTVVKKKNKRVETLERHIPQMLLRGEQIVLIIKME